MSADRPVLPVVHDPAGIAKLLNVIRRGAKPPRVSMRWLNDLEFGRQANLDLRELVWRLGLTNGNGQPTRQWVFYQVEGGFTLQRLLRRCYGRLYADTPSPTQVSEEHLTRWLEAHRESEPDAALMIETFRTLHYIAGAAAERAPAPTLVPVKLTDTTLPNQLSEHRAGINRARVGIVFQLPAGLNYEQYRTLFTALRDVFYL